MTRGLRAYAVLLVIGAAWGISAPLIKIAVGAGHRPVAIVFWQSLLATLVLGVALAARGKLWSMPRDARHLGLYAVVGLCGMALPSWASYSATRFLPSGVVSIIISLVPVFALPLALALGTERFVPRRLLGVALGALAMALLIGPEASLPAPGLWIWVPVAALAPFFYAIEGAYVYGASARRAGPFQMLWAGYVVSILTSGVLVWLDHAPLLPESGFGWPGLGFVLSGLLGIGAYGGYLWLLRRTGSVFGAQVSYTVTGMGVVWAMVLLGETYSGWIWAALALLFLGLFLVQPRRADAPRIAAGTATGTATGAADVRA